jgi:hypothetical protein
VIARADDQQIVRPLAPLGTQNTLEFSKDFAGSPVADPSIPVDAGNPLVVRQQEVGPHCLVEMMCSNGVNGQLQVLDIGERRDISRWRKVWPLRLGMRC